MRKSRTTRAVTMTPAEIDSFIAQTGKSKRQVALSLGLQPMAVSRWKTAGRIPKEHHDRILMMQPDAADTLNAAKGEVIILEEAVRVVGSLATVYQRKEFKEAAYSAALLLEQAKTRLMRLEGVGV